MLDQKIMEERFEIWNAWCLFSRDQHGLVRLILWVVMWIFNIFRPTIESVEVLGNTCLIFSVSLTMEYFPALGRFPQKVQKENVVRTWIAKGLTALFLLLLGIIIVYSCVLEVKPPEELTVEVAWSNYQAFFIIVATYLLINCTIGLVYTRVKTGETPEDQKRLEKQKEMEELIDMMWKAGREGGMGNANPPKPKEKEK